MRTRGLLVTFLLAVPYPASAVDADAVDASGRKGGSVSVERAGDPFTADGRTWTPFSVVVRNATQTRARFFGTIALDGGKAGDCTWYVEVDAGATKRIEKPCRQRRVFTEFSVAAKVELPRAKP